MNAPVIQILSAAKRCEDSLKITMSKEGLSFCIEPDKNDAVIFVDIPYATTKLEKATDADGNLVFNGEIGFKTVTISDQRKVGLRFRRKDDEKNMNLR